MARDLKSSSMDNCRHRSIIEIHLKRIGHGWASLHIKYDPVLIDIKKGTTLEDEDLGIKVYTDPADLAQERLNKIRYGKARSILERRQSEFKEGRIRFLSEDFISFYRHLASTKTYNLTASLKQLIMFTGDRCPFYRINRDFILRYQTFLESEAVTSKGKFLTHSTVSLYMGQMIYICRAAIDKGYMSEEDIAGVSLSRIPDDTTQVSLAELRKLYRCSNRDPRVERLLSLKLLTGLPVSYLLRLGEHHLTSDEFGNWILDVQGKRGGKTYISKEAAEIILDSIKDTTSFPGMSYPEVNCLFIQWIMNAGLNKRYRFRHFKMQIDSLSDIFSRKPR